MRRLAALFVAAACVLGGCASAPLSIDASVSATMQADVVEVADAAANGDYESGLARLDELQSALDAAIADEVLSAGKATSIQTAIDAVRADLAELLELATPEPEPAPTTEPEKPGKGNEDKPGKPEKPGKGNKND